MPNAVLYAGPSLYLLWAYLLGEAERPGHCPEARRYLAGCVGVAALGTSGLLAFANHKSHPDHWLDRYAALPVLVCVPATAAMLVTLWQEEPAGHLQQPLQRTWWERNALRVCAVLYLAAFGACVAAVATGPTAAAARRKEKKQAAPRRPATAPWVDSKVPSKPASSSPIVPSRSSTST